MKKKVVTGIMATLLFIGMLTLAFDIQPVKAELPPIAIFTCSPPTPTVNQTVTFDASASYDPDGSIVSYAWDFGDGTIKVKMNGDINGDGWVNIFDVCIVTTSWGCGPEDPNWDSRADLSGDDFVDILDVCIVTTYWRQSDCACASYVYTDVGIHAVTLTVTDDDGLTGTYIQGVEVVPRPREEEPLSFTDGTWIEYDLNNHITVTSFQVGSYQYRNESAYVYKDFGSGYFNDFVHEFNAVIMNGSNIVYPMDVDYFIWVLANQVDNMFVISDECLMIWGWALGHENRFRLQKNMGGVYDDANFYYEFGTWYHFKVQRQGSTVTCSIYDSGGTNLLDTLSITDDLSYRYLFVAQTFNEGVDRWQEGALANLILEPSV